MKRNTFLPVLSDYFASYLPDTKGVKQNTIISYQYAFQLLFEFMNDKKGVPPEKVGFDSLSEETMLEYLDWIEKERGCSSATRNLRRTAISSFARYAMKRNFGDTASFYSGIMNIPRKRSRKKTEINYFTKEEMAIILKAPDARTKIGRRDAVLLSFLYASGARAQELCDLTVNDVYFGGETNIRLLGKGDKPRLITIPETCASLLKKYMGSVNLDAANSKDRCRHVFSSQTHEKMSISCVEEIVKKYVKAVKTEHPHLFGRSKYTPHSFRHSIAVHMLECGESLVVIKAFLGHASIKTTTIYAEVTPELANRYLKERGKAIPTLSIQERAGTSEFLASLSFLKKISHKG